MERIFSTEQTRLFIVSSSSSVLAFFTPTHGFTLALLVMFIFNIICGMRADGVSINRKCRNFSMRKFRDALVEFILYISIIYVMFSVMTSIGDRTEAVIVVKTLTYIFMYVYIQNAFKNLITAYPTNIAFRIIYYAIRFEITKAVPSHVQKIIERYEKHNDNEKI